jgi:ADP-heptose:LPS heptosyltransferase
VNPSGKTLAVRLDALGDMLVTGPAVRALSAGSRSLTMLAGPEGAAAAALLPGVDEVLEYSAPWIQARPGPLDRDRLGALAGEVAARGFDQAVIFTSFHQSALPTALVLRWAGVPRISAISEDYAGSLLDVRHQVPDDIPETERALSLARAAGFEPAAGDDRLPAIRRADLPDARALFASVDRSWAESGSAEFVFADPDSAESGSTGFGSAGPGSYVVAHPGCSAPARAWPSEHWAEAVRELAAAGHHVVVTGSASERALTAEVAGSSALDLGGRTTLAELAAVLAGAQVVVASNTGPAHLAAAARTPVVSLFAPVVPAVRWAPRGSEVVLLGDQDAPCAGTRARECPVPGHPCLTGVTARDVVAAVEKLAGSVPIGGADA